MPDPVPSNQRDSRYDILLEPVQIGPKRTKNRFYQVPHCNGMGYRDPTALAKMREIKAEGGWGVVCTEEVEIHPTSDIAPFIELRLWDDGDIPTVARIAERIHAHDALAGIELAHNGMNAPNLYTREVPLGPTAMPVYSFWPDPIQARAMDKADIANMRQWHRAAVKRSLIAEFDIVYVYLGHSLTILSHFLSPTTNHRTDEYGGSLTNRMRLLREVLEDTGEELAGRAAMACRISMDELHGPDGLEQREVEDVIGTLAELPDLWDVTLAPWDNDSPTARFAEEGHAEPYFVNVKSLTTKPVVGIGRYTSPDRMADVVRRGLLDLIGAARPSIADPFLPTKVAEGRVEDIRECIGCNICVSGDFTMSPIRCTQNPTMGEEWRRGWHPERIASKTSDDRILIVGGGPAGLEAAHALGKRGYEVTLAEASEQLGGRVTLESKLPGLSTWARVRDYRLEQFKQLPNVTIYEQSAMDADQILQSDASHIVIATGACWRSDGVGRHRTAPVAVTDAAVIYTPDQLMAGTLPEPKSQVLIWDDDHYYLGGVLAELLVQHGCTVALATPAGEVSNWTRATMEQHRIQKRMLELDVAIHPFRGLESVSAEEATLSCTFTGRQETLHANSVVLVTARESIDHLRTDLADRQVDWADAGIQSVSVIGDALAPATIAHAVYAGHRYAQEFGSSADDRVPIGFHIERTSLTELDN